MKLGLSNSPRLLPDPIVDRRPQIEQTLSAMSIMPKERLTAYFKAALLHKDGEAHLKATLTGQAVPEKLLPVVSKVTEAIAFARSEVKLNRMLGLAADPAPTRIDRDGILHWDRGKMTRTMDRTGLEAWRMKDTGLLHRIGGAAEIRPDGSAAHWKNGAFQFSVVADGALRMPISQQVA